MKNTYYCSIIITTTDILPDNRIYPVQIGNEYL